jgi:hypothetical protein
MEPKWKGREQEYQKEYMREWRAKEKVLHDWQDQNEKRIEDRFVKLDTDDPVQKAINQVTYARLYVVSRKMRDVHDFDEEERIYSALWKELEINEADLKEHGITIYPKET